MTSTPTKVAKDGQACVEDDSNLGASQDYFIVTKSTKVEFLSGVEKEEEVEEEDHMVVGGLDKEIQSIGEVSAAQLWMKIWPGRSTMGS